MSKTTAGTTEQFKAALLFFDDYHPDEPATARALFAAMWFIENVTHDDLDRSDIFFEVRELARKAWASVRS